MFSNSSKTSKCWNVLCVQKATLKVLFVAHVCDELLDLHTTGLQMLIKYSTYGGHFAENQSAHAQIDEWNSVQLQWASFVSASLCLYRKQFNF